VHSPDPVPDEPSPLADDAASSDEPALDGYEQDFDVVESALQALDADDLDEAERLTASLDADPDSGATPSI